MRGPLVLILFISGVSALIFESLWFRLAGLSLGNSVWSASLVLASFMGGLALGTGLVARFHLRITHPVRLYAALECAIGVGGIGVVLLLPRFPDLLGPALGTLTDMPALLNAVRVAIAFGILLLPAVAMGATLPVLVQAMSLRDPNFGVAVGRLYGWNTLGAMLGALSAAIILVPFLGVLSSGLFALILNLLAAFIALRYSKTQPIIPATQTAMPDFSGTVSDRSLRYIALAFLSGALMLALEVIWFRFLLLTTKGTSLTFAVMLAVVLAGIGGGSLAAAGMFHRDDQAYRWLRPVMSLSAALVVLTYWGYDLFTLYRVQNEISTVMFVGFSTFLMCPVAALSGAAFTMINRAVKDDLSTAARTSGTITFSNTLGAMLGSIGAGFVLLPVLGIEMSLFLIAFAYGASVFLVPGSDRTSLATKKFGYSAFAGSVACLVFFPFGLMQDRFLGAQIGTLPGHSLVAVREGLVETIRYYQRDVFGEPKEFRLVTNGYSMSGVTTSAKRYMKLYVYLPIALNADTRSALLISFGVGSTAKALTDSSSLTSIDIVDISRDILEMSSIVYPDYGNPLRDERVRVHVEDGRFFLNTTANRYDLITSEPPPPKVSGVVNLYSREYFTLMRRRLNPGGYASYWLPVEQLEPVETLAIAKAFCEVFEDCSLWSGAGMEWMLLGSNGAKAVVNADEFSAQWHEPHVARELVALGFEMPDQLGSLFIADSEFLARLTVDVAPVTDNHPARISSRHVRYPAYVELYDMLMNEEERLLRFKNSEQIGRLWPADLRQGAEAYFQYDRLIKNHFTAGEYARNDDRYLWEAIDHLLTETRLTTLPLWLLGSDMDTQAIVDKVGARADYEEGVSLELAKKFTSERDYKTALHHIKRHLESGGTISHTDMYLYLYLLGKNGLLAEAASVVSQVEAVAWPGQGDFLAWFASKFVVNPIDSSEQQRLEAEQTKEVAFGL